MFSVPQITTNKNNIATNTEDIANLKTANTSLGGWFSSHTLFNGSPTEVATNFYNHAAGSLLDTELVTWVLLKGLIDQIFPIGCLQLSSLTSVPSSFGGYITWTLVTAADGKYLRCYADGLSTGHTPDTVTAGTIASHTHATSSITIPT
jgi:hypothetical protein